MVVVSGAAVGFGGIAATLALSIDPGQGAFIGGFAVLTGAVLTFLNGKYGRDQTQDLETEKLATEDRKLSEQKAARDQLHQREIARELRARFATCSDQLGSNSFAVRLAGVYAFAALADDFGAEGNIADRQVCIDVLCGYLRTSTKSDVHAPATDTNPSKTRRPSAQEEQVRSTIVRVIADHTRDVRLVGVRNAQVLEPPWKFCDFDLEGARLTNIDWSHCQFLGSLNLAGARFISGANFRNSIFEHVSFEGARFGLKSSPVATIGFRNCIFNRASFDRARFLVSVEFSGAESRGVMSFRRATFRGARNNFSDMTFERGSSTSFSDAAFAGVVRFVDGTFRGRVDLSGASFVGVSSLSVHSAKHWDVPPKLPWREGDPIPTYANIEWPPSFVDGMRAHAAKLGAAERAAQGSTASPMEEPTG
ncbi:pentapeptide repeat-containing protein [Rhodococcoides corynebacterioides]|uniref:pentapeptide repeat-containing protein n=1 Tax=Rhodococcoides corynebacterioides TaxID=53972 RepID=UPI001C9BB336|nr:pentapeptide repeat-containing protein [Rhodococcus corynebacterioides]